MLQPWEVAGGRADHRTGGCGRMRISYTPEQEQLRRELRDYFGTLITPERREALMAMTGVVPAAASSLIATTSLA